MSTQVLKRFVAVAAMAALFAMSASPAFATGDCCQSCGCHEPVKKKLCLVRTYEQVKIPQYQCAPVNVFHPDRGALCYTGYRKDTFITLHHTFHVCETCTGCDTCGCPKCAKTVTTSTTASSRTECGCKTLYGAKMSGCHCTQQVAVPTGEICTVPTPVFKWVAIEVCHGCASSTGPLTIAPPAVED